MRRCLGCEILLVDGGVDLSVVDPQGKMMLKQRTPLKRTPFKSKPPVYPPREEREPLPLRPIRVEGISTGPRVVFAPQHKFRYVRNAKLIEAYRLIPCQFCGYWAPQSIVGCHSNWAIHGKCKSKKASDDRCASGCPRCHFELDQGKTWTEDERRRKWFDAHVKTVRRLVAANYWPASVEVPDTSTFPKEWE
jgi:hypothetical protein